MNKQIDFKEFKKILFGLSEMFQRDLKPTTHVMYFAALSDLTIEQVNSAANRWARTGKFFPKPAELREFAIETLELTAGEAWVEVREQMDRVCGAIGVYPVFSSPVIEVAVQSLGGLNTIWMAGIDQEGMYRAHFLKCFEAIRQRDNKDLLLGAPNRSEAKLLLDVVSNGVKERLENNG